MAENKFNGTVEALFHGMDSVLSSKTVVGEAILETRSSCLWWRFPLVLEQELLQVNRKTEREEVLVERCHRVQFLLFRMVQQDL